MGDAVVSPAEPETPAQSFPERLMGVFISPRETFEDVARKPDFIIPLVSLIVLSVAGTELFLHKIGWYDILVWAYQHNTNPSKMRETDFFAMLPKLITYYTWFSHVVGFVWVPLVVLLSALVGLIAVRGIFGGQIKFKTAFAISCYAYLVNIAYQLVGIAMTEFGDPDHIIGNPRSPTPTCVGFFLPPLETPHPLLALGSSLELFTFWYMVLLAVGFSVSSDRKVKPVPLFFCFFGLWLVGVLINTGLATLG